MINSTNLLTIKSNKINHTTFLSAATPVTNPQAQPKTTNSSLLNAYLNNMAIMFSGAVR